MTDTPMYRLLPLTCKLHRWISQQYLGMFLVPQARHPIQEMGILSPSQASCKLVLRYPTTCPPCHSLLLFRKLSEHRCKTILLQEGEPRKQRRRANPQAEYPEKQRRCKTILLQAGEPRKQRRRSHLQAEYPERRRRCKTILLQAGEPKKQRRRSHPQAEYPEKRRRSQTVLLQAGEPKKQCRFNP